MLIDQQRLAPQDEWLVEPAFLRKRMDSYFENPRRRAWPEGEHILVGREPGPGGLLLRSNDYLAMASHPDVLAAVRRDVAVDADAAIMAAVFLHGATPQSRFESAMATLLGSEATVLSQSGWAANTGLLQSIVEPGTPVYIDMFAHMSLHEGIRLGGGCPHMFRHNNVRALEQLVRRHGPGFIVVDSIYSTTGAIAPLRELVELSERHGCVLIVDEAHSLGTHGPRGAGLVAELGLTARVHFRTASLAKAFAGRAGIVACSTRAAEFLKYQANPAIFSSGLMPSEIARLDAIRQAIEGADDRRSRLRAVAQRLREGLRQLGYCLGGSESQIVSLHPGEEWRLIALRNALEARGVFGSVFCAPATPANGALLRFTLHSALGDDDIERVLAACAEVRDRVQLAAWASTRRMHVRRQAEQDTGSPRHSDVPAEAC